ncbi:hypothetical protein SARC_12409, partial [Sphaeroforma arctica JP610]
MLQKVTLGLLKVENEENALVCLRIIVDLNKQYRSPQYNNNQAFVREFLDIVYRLYQSLPNTLLQDQHQAKDDGGAGEYLAIVPSISSFKVLTECPIIVVILLQLYKTTVQERIPSFVPLIIQTLELKPNAATLSRQAFSDFVACQVKTLSFLAYVLTRFQEVITPYRDVIPPSVIELLLRCPTDSAAIRKELLIATRHILATDFRTSFVPQIETLLKEDVLIGPGRTSNETLRPLAYSTLADLVHHVRQQLPFNQLVRTVKVYSRNIHDESLPLSIQTMSCKLLLNLIESIVKKDDATNDGRGLLIEILENFAAKFKAVRLCVPRLQRPRPKSPTKVFNPGTSKRDAELHADAKTEAEATDAGPQSDKGDLKKDKDAEVAAYSYLAPIQTVSTTSGDHSQSQDHVKDCRLLVKTLILGLKTIVWGMNQCVKNKDNTQPSNGVVGAGIGMPARAHRPMNIAQQKQQIVHLQQVQAQALQRMNVAASTTAAMTAAATTTGQYAATTSPTIPAMATNGAASTALSGTTGASPLLLGAGAGASPLLMGTGAHHKQLAAGNSPTQHPNTSTTSYPSGQTTPATPQSTNTISPANNGTSSTLSSAALSAMGVGAASGPNRLSAEVIMHGTPAVVQPPRYVTADEAQIFLGLLHDSIDCFRVYSIPLIGSAQAQAQAQAQAKVQGKAGVSSTTGATAKALVTAPTKEEKDLIEHFASVFTMLDATTLAEIFETSLEVLFEKMCANQAL